MSALLRLVEAVVGAACRAWFQEMRRLREAEQVGGGEDLRDRVRGEVRRQTEEGESGA